MIFCYIDYIDMTCGFAALCVSTREGKQRNMQAEREIAATVATGS